MSSSGSKGKSTKRCEGEEVVSNGQTGAMLDMLAEVASQTLRQSESPPTPVKRKRSKEACGMPLNQARMLSVNQLVRTFSRFEGDELRRTFSYKCLLIPRKCGVRFESFGSEAKARNLIKEHLLAHLDNLPEGEVLQVPKQREEVPYKKQSNQVKTKKLKVLKPELKAIEVTDIPVEFNEVVVETEPENSGHTNNISEALAECYEKLQTEEHEEHAAENTGEHDYFKAQAQKLDTEAEENYTHVETIWINPENQNQYESSSGITNYVVTVDDSEDHPILSVSNEVVVKTEMEEPINEEIIDSHFLSEFITIKTEPAVLQDNRLFEGEGNFEENFVERDEHRQHKKPKGKAKFIGQSAAEKEMAVRMIESMKLRQGSSEPLECQICVPSRVFTAPTTLISHYRSHAGIKPYECHLCGGVFTRQHSLNYHLLIHSNKTRFTCNDCGRKFRHPSHFKEHQRRHTGEAPFECSDCVIRFKTRNTYKRHLKTRHGKVLTQSGGIIILSEEEFRRVRTAPRSLQSRVSSDKENNRRPRTKVVNLIRRKKRPEEEGQVADLQKLNLSDDWNTNLLEGEVKLEEPQLAILQTADGPTTVMVLTADKIIYNST